MKPSSAKQKGRNLQQKVARLILDAFPHLEDDDVRSTSMGAGGEDLQLSPAARRVVPHNIETKKHARFAVYEFYDQAKKHGPHEPLVVIEADRRKPLAIVDLEHFLSLLKIAATGCATPVNL